MNPVSIDSVDSWYFTFLKFGDETRVRFDLTPHEEREVFSYSWLVDKEERHRWNRFRFEQLRCEFAWRRAAVVHDMNPSKAAYLD